MVAGIQKSIFGRMPDGTEIEQYTLTNANGLSCKIITYGGIITEINTPDRHGKFANIVLGYDNLEDYLKCTDYRGAIIGRVANRIAGASFELDGKTYKLAANDGPNHLHGGIRGFDKQIWTAAAANNMKAELGLHYPSEAGEEGYPGKLTIGAIYQLNDDDELHLDFFATGEQATPVNLTNHTYWNLAGTGNCFDHELRIAADYYTPMDKSYIPTGKIECVEQTPFDFTVPISIKARLGRLPDESRGYNANYVLRTDMDYTYSFPAAQVYERGTGRVVELFTDQPGLQFYSGTFLRVPYQGFCLETQKFPDALHHPQFPSIILPFDEVYRHRVTWRFSAK